MWSISNIGAVPFALIKQTGLLKAILIPNSKAHLDCVQLDQLSQDQQHQDR